MKIFNGLFILICSLVISNSSFAIESSGNITIEGCHAYDSQCFIALDSTSGSGCKFGIVYYDMTNLGSKGLKATAIAAKVSKKSVSVSYSMEADGVCRLAYLYQNP